MKEAKRRGRPLKNESRMEKRLAFRVTEKMHSSMEIICNSKGINKTDFVLAALEKAIHYESEKNFENIRES